MWVGNGSWSPVEANRRQEEYEKNRVIKKLKLKSVKSGDLAINRFLESHIILSDKKGRVQTILRLLLGVILPLLYGAAGYVFFNKNPFIIAIFVCVLFRFFGGIICQMLTLDFSFFYTGKLVTGENVLDFKTAAKDPVTPAEKAEYEASKSDSRDMVRQKADRCLDKYAYTARDFGKNRTQQLNEFRNFALSLSADSRTDRLIKSDRFFEDFVDVINSCYDAGEKKQTIDDILPVLKDNPEALKTLVNCYFVIKLG